MNDRVNSLQIKHVEACSELNSGDTTELWELFVGIHQTWGEPRACRPEDMASRWREFIRVKCEDAPSYLEVYRDAADLLRH